MREIIEVNGVKYDAISGQKIEKDEQKDTNSRAESFLNNSEEIHFNLQRSNTLNRKFVKRPDNLTLSQKNAIEQFKNRHNYAEIRKAAIVKTGEVSHAQIAHFEGLRGSADRVISPISSQKQTTKNIQKTIDKDDIKPFAAHPIQQQAIEKMREQKNEKVLPSARKIKESAISEALIAMREEQKTSKKSRGIHKKSWISKRMASFLACCAILAIGTGYLTYLSAPELSVKMAAIQSGVDAKLPRYTAQGYSMNGLASFDGESVNLKFANGNKNYTLKQAQSSWDSVALLENYVEKNWDKDYSTYQEKGLTIYKNRNSEAAWVNNGTVYTIDGSNDLSAEDIRKIATSL